MKRETLRCLSYWYYGLFYTNGKKSGLNKLLDELREMAVKTNKEFAEKIGINQSIDITCVKPSGTVSQLVDVHLVFMHVITHTIFEQCVATKKDPLTKMMVDQGFLLRMMQ